MGDSRDSPARDSLTPFDDALVAAVAAESGIAETRLRRCLRAHQEQVRDLPGVEDIVYEWRRAFGNPVVERREDAYLLRVEASVWPEFSRALGFTDDEASAVRRVHERHVPGDDERPGMVLTRP